MNKAEWMTWAYWIMILVVMATCLFVVTYLGGNASQCLADPIAYYSSKIGQDCFCMTG